MDTNSYREQPVPVTARAPWQALQAARVRFEDAEVKFVTGLDFVARDVKEVLFVNPALDLQQSAQRALRLVANVDVCSTFAEARARLVAKPPDVLITSVRLHAHNGLHLVYLAAAQAQSTRCLVYATHEDFSLAREVKAAGAFFIRAPHLAVSLKSYVAATLPPEDRRDPFALDRRQSPRGGRRCIDK
jgi:DNA-binding NtrC family response regulator